MDSDALTAVVTAGLLAAVGLGWILGWVVIRLNRRAPGSERDEAEILRRMHEAEMERDAARRDMETVRADLLRELSARDAELEATMSGLGGARREAMEWRRAYEDLAARSGLEAESRPDAARD